MLAASAGCKGQIQTHDMEVFETKKRIGEDAQVSVISRAGGIQCLEIPGRDGRRVRCMGVVG